MRRAGGALRSVAIVLWAAALCSVIAVSLSARPVSGSPAPDFTLTDVDGSTFRLSDFRGRITLLDFMYIGCSSCELARPVLVDVYRAHLNVMAGVSIDIFPTDSDQALRDYRFDEQNNVARIPWHLAKDTDTVQTKFSVGPVVRLFLVDQQGYVIFDKEGMFPGEEASLRSSVEATIDAALRGEATRIQIQQASIYSLAVIAAVGSFFSPCSFPLFPGYMAVFLGLDSQNREVRPRGLAVAQGMVSSIGIILVYGIIWIALLLIGTAANALVPALQPAVGVILILMGALMFTAVQFNFLVNPFRRLRQILFPNWTPNAAQSSVGKLFSYGVGYGAAGFGCVAPPFIAAVLNSTVLGGFLAGAAVFLVYALIVVGIMIGVTLVLATLGQAALKKMNRYTEVIKKISAALLIVAGAYLVYYWYAAYIA